MCPLNSWDLSEVQTYPATITKKVPGYEILHTLSAILISRSIRADASILVIGAGGGEELVRLAEALPRIRITALDTSSIMLKLAKSRCEDAGISHRVQFICCDIHELPLTIRYDAAVCLLMLQFIAGTKEKQRFLLCVAAHLQPHSPFILATICGDPISDSFQKQLLQWSDFAKRNEQPTHHIKHYIQSMGVTNHPIERESLIKLLHESNFHECTSYFRALFVKAILCRKSDMKQ